MNESISQRILALVNAGETVRAAFDEVIGEGSYVRLAGEVYDSLRAGEGAASKEEKRWRSR
jgi:hypothetical protein